MDKKGGFTIKKRAGVAEQIAKVKQQLKQLEQQQKNDDLPEAESKPSPTDQPKSNQSNAKIDPYQKRKPLTAKEKKWLSDLWYKGDGAYSGRDVLYQRMKRIYEKEKTPKEEQISRRRMWMFLSSQETSQIHRAIKSHSVEIRPISTTNKFNIAQTDLVFHKGTGKDPLSKYKAILTFIDVSTRYLFARLLTGLKQKDSIKAVESILDEALQLIPVEDRKQRNQLKNKSKTWSLVISDNGSEFGSEFSNMLNTRNVKHQRGTANRSTGQGIVERVHSTLMGAIEREVTSTKRPWYELVEKAVRQYNMKTNRNLRLKKEGDENYTIYTPEELFKEKREVLAQLHTEKMKEVNVARKDHRKHERNVETGQLVRIVLQSKRKDSMSKGYTPNWSLQLYKVYKIKKPSADSSSTPYLFYVRNTESGKPHRGAMTIHDLQIVDSVEKPPKDIQVKKKVGVGTRTGDKSTEIDKPTTPKTKTLISPPTIEPANKPSYLTKTKTIPNKKKKPSPKEDELIGKRVQSFIDYLDKEYKITGKVTNKQKRTKGAQKIWYFKVQWDRTNSNKWDYQRSEYMRLADLQKILINQES